MTRLAVYSNRLDADIRAQRLMASGIHAEVVGAREYVAIATGVDMGHYELYVDDGAVEAATRLLAEIDAEAEAAPFDENHEDSPELGSSEKSADREDGENFGLRDSRYYYKRALLYAIMGIVIAPIVFNFVSLRYLLAFRAAEKSDASREFKTALIVLLQLPALAAIYFIIRSFT